MKLIICFLKYIKLVAPVTNILNYQRNVVHILQIPHIIILIVQHVIYGGR